MRQTRQLNKFTRVAVRAVATSATAFAVLIGTLIGASATAAEIEEMIVTAQKREQKLQDIPQSIQAFSGEFIENNGVYNITDAINLVPGGSVSFSGGNGTQLYNLRGTGAQGRIGQLAIGFYIDDVPFISGGAFGPPIELFDLEQLEVLRGPQGTLYGQGSMGGTFIITTSKPNLSEVEGRARVYTSNMTEASWGNGFDATVSFPIIQDELAIRFTGGYDDATGLAESPEFPSDEDIDNYDQFDLRTKILWTPNENLSVTGTAWHSNETRNFSPGIWASTDPPLIRGTGGVPGDVEAELTLYSLLVDWDTALGRLTSSTTYSDKVDLFDAAFSFLTTIPGLGTLENVLQLTVPFEADAFDQEFRLVSGGDGPMHWIVGAEYSSIEGESETLSAFISGPLKGLVPDALGRSETESERWAVYGEMSYDLMDGKLIPLIGLRYYEDELNLVSFLNANDPTGAPFVANETFNAVSPRFNLSYLPTDDLTLYLNIAKGFRSGAFNTPTQVVTANALGIALDNTLKESVLWSYEVGARMVLFDNTLRIEPAIWYEIFDDYQFEGSAGNVNFALPIKEVEGVGFDLLLTYQTPIDGLFVTFNGDINSIEPSDIAADAVSTQAPLGDGKQLPFVPEWSYTFTANYEMPLGERGLDGFGALSWSKRDSQVDFITAFVSDDVDELQLRFGVRRDWWRVTLWGENLLDDKGPSVIAGGLENRRDRLTYGLTVDASFGAN